MKSLFIFFILFGANFAVEECPTGCEECFCIKDPDDFLDIVCEDYREQQFPQCITREVRSVAIVRSEITTLTVQDFSNATSLKVLSISESLRLTTIEDGTFENAASLQELWIVTSALDKLPDVLSRSLTNLTKLYLQHNTIKVIPIDFFVGLTSLEELDLSYNNITGIAQRFSDNHNLTSLDLSYNFLESISFDDLLGLASLSNLKLSHNQLTSIAEGTLLETSIEALYLDHNRLDFIPDGLFDNIPSLHILNLEANGFQEVPMFSLSRATSLAHLWLSENPIQKIGANSFDTLNNLEGLHLQNMDYLSTVEDGAFARLKNLMELNVNYCPMLKNFSAAALVPEDKENLIFLFLNNNTIRKFDENIFNNLPMLTFTSIAGNPLICSCETLWMKTYMDAGEPEWVLSWKEGNDAVLCNDPANMQGQRLVDIPLEELTCEKPEVISRDITMEKKYAFVEVLLRRGLPSTSWRTPDGTIVHPTTGQKHSPLATISPGPYFAAEEFLSNYSVLASLIIQPLSDSSFGTYTLTATNAGGSLELNIDLVAPTGTPPHKMKSGEIAGIVLTSLIILFVIIGVVYIYLVQRRQMPYQSFEQTTNSPTETAEGPMLGDNEDDEDGEDETARVTHQPRSYGATTNNPFEEQERPPKII